MKLKFLNWICRILENSVNKKENRYLIIDLLKLDKIDNEIQCEIKQNINGKEIIYIQVLNFLLDFTNRNLK